MLVWKITLLNDTAGKTISEKTWAQVPAEAQDGGAYRLLTKEFGRSTGKLVDAHDPRRAYGWKLHQVRTEEGSGRRFDHVALVQLGWRQDSKVLAYDVVKGRPIAGSDANKVKFTVPPTQYPGQVTRWKERSPPSDTSPSRVATDYRTLKDIVAEMARINLEQARGERSPKSAAEAFEHLIKQIETA